MKRWIFMVLCCVSLFGCFLWLVNNNLFEQTNATTSETEPTTKSLMSVNDMLNEYQKIKAEEDAKLKNLEWFDKYVSGLPFPPGTVASKNQNNGGFNYSRELTDVSREEAVKYYTKLKELCDKHFYLTLTEESVYFRGEYKGVTVDYNWYSEPLGENSSRINCLIQNATSSSTIYGNINNINNSITYGGEEAKWFEEYFGDLPEPDFSIDFVSHNENDGMTYATFINFVTEEKITEYVDKLRQSGVKETYFSNENNADGYGSQMVFMGNTDDMTVTLSASCHPNQTYAQFSVEKKPVENPQARETAERHFDNLKLPHEFAPEVIYRDCVYSADRYNESYSLKLSSMDYQNAQEYLQYLKSVADFVQFSGDNTTYIQFMGNLGDDYISFSCEKVGRGELSIKENHNVSIYNSTYSGFEAVWDSEKMHGVPAPKDLNITNIEFTNSVIQTITVHYSMDKTKKITEYIELLEESGYEKIITNFEQAWAKDNIKITIVWSGNINYGGTITITDGYEPVPVYTTDDNIWNIVNVEMCGVPFPEELNISNISVTKDSTDNSTVTLSYVAPLEEAAKYMELLENSGYINVNKESEEKFRKEVANQYPGGTLGKIVMWRFEGLKEGVRVVVHQSSDDNNSGTITITKEE